MRAKLPAKQDFELHGFFFCKETKQPKRYTCQLQSVKFERKLVQKKKDRMLFFPDPDDEFSVIREHYFQVFRSGVEQFRIVIIYKEL